MAAKIILIGAILVIACSNVGVAANSIVVESRTFAPNQSACSLGIWLSNDEPIVALTLVIEARSLTGGAFYQVASSPLNRPVHQPGRRLDRSPLGSADPGGAWPAASPINNRYATPDGIPCGGPVSNTYNTLAPSVDAISPDGWLYETHSVGDESDPFFDLIDLPVGADNPIRDSASWVFVFNANGSPGCFEIDTCCVRPSGHTIFVNRATQMIAPAFTRGLVCIEGDPVNLAPVITCPADIEEIAGAGQVGAIVNYSVTVVDEDPSLAAVCDPAPGSFFPIGTTLTSCIATDTAGLADTCTFDVTVHPPPPNQPPYVQCPPLVSASIAVGETGANVTFSVPVLDEGPPLDAVCTPPSGSFFNLGQTLVECVAQDAGGLADTCYFYVYVSDMQESSVAVESRTFGIGQQSCSVGVFITNHFPVAGLVLPIEIRSQSGGAFYKGPIGSSFFRVQTGSRLDASTLDLMTIRRFDTANANNTCSGPTGNSWGAAAIAVGGTSPDGVEYAAISDADSRAGDEIALAPGVDPPPTSGASLVFVFDADTLEGCFEFDTACTTPSNHLGLVTVEGQGVPAEFSKGVVCLTSCLCECNGNPAAASSPDINVLDVVYATNVAFRNAAPVPDLNGLCPVNATDVDCDGESTVIDVVKIIDVAFRNGDPAVVFCSPCE